VRLNGAESHNPRQPVRIGDKLEIGARISVPEVERGLKIQYEDEHLLLICKSAGLLSVATPHERDRTAFAGLRRYLAQRDPKRKLYIVHRLDKYVSGLLVFAKSEEVKEKLKARFQRHDIERKYWAIVEGRVAKDKGTIRSRLVENGLFRMHSTDDPDAGKLAVTHYRVLRRFPKYTSLEITLETGRKNQIRAHLSEMGHPIAGDRAYGSKTNPLGRMGLHAYCLGFTHPMRGTPLRITTDPPPEFRRYFPAG
jgi:RluA family pseudouridine synthase